MKIKEAIKFLEKQVPNPSKGLPDEIFYYISKLTPLLNVDLLIKDEKGRTLLAWRDDVYCGKGWHIPGGIVRFKETLETRIRKVAESEIGEPVIFENIPVAVNQCINHNRDIRGHFISILYKCYLPSTFSPKNKGLSRDDAGFLMWHASCPEDLIKFHHMYKEYI